MLLMIKPIEVTDSRLVSTNVDETDYAAWSSATTYALGARVVRTTTHRIYESAQGGNLNKTPEDNTPTWWLEVEATDKWKPFDGRISLRASSATAIWWRIKAPVRCNFVAVFGIITGTVRVRVYTSAGALRSDTTKTAGGFFPYGYTTWTNAFTGFEFYDSLAFMDLNIQADDEVRVDFADSTLHEVGEIVIGPAIPLGDALMDTKTGFIDYSTKERDYYGDVVKVKRPAGDRAEYVVRAVSMSVERLLRQLRSVRSTPAVFVTQTPETLGTMVYGYVRDPMIGAAGPTLGLYTLEVEGVT